MTFIPTVSLEERNRTNLPNFTGQEETWDGPLSYIGTLAHLRWHIIAQTFTYACKHRNMYTHTRTITKMTYIYKGLYL